MRVYSWPKLSVVDNASIAFMLFTVGVRVPITVQSTPSLVEMDTVILFLVVSVPPKVRAWNFTCNSVKSTVENGGEVTTDVDFNNCTYALPDRSRPVQPLVIAPGPAAALVASTSVVLPPPEPVNVLDSLTSK